ncbi:G2/M phase-specific E3 ubiquitin-protein ligase-like [Garra rufa]|uniref:G2/M phase-specific E3 ubiquitin-protein ligase-like n=1 Tax=Garra rufa TaxID=137080 RepID=UPI003CCE6402
MPLQLLAIHVNSCSSVSFSDSDESITVDAAEGVHDEGSKELFNCDSDVEFVPPVLNAEPSKKSEYASCPICQAPYPLDVLEVHASTCGERHEENQRTLDVEKNEPKSLDDILQNLAEQVDNSQTFSVCVTRSNFFHRALQQWKRQKKSTPKCSLKVCFVGEAGIDTGAIKKEFLTDLMNGIELRYFEPGPDNKGKNPIYSISALEESYFRSFGEIIACSLAQGGPAPDFMRNWCYTYLATGDFDCLVVTSEDVTDVETIELIEKVRIATNDELRGLTDDLLSCGYTGLIKTDRKDLIIRTIILHSLARVLPMLDQMRKGLQLYNLPDVMEQHMDLCRPLFVPLQDNKPDANFLMASCKPDLSEKGTSRHNLEQSILNYFQDFLQELEDVDTEVVSNTKTLTVPAVLQWLTGQAHKPVLPSERNNFEIHVKFNHVCQQEAHVICFPIVSACTKTITFPVAHMSSYSEFKHVLTLALRFGNVFGRV